MPRLILLGASLNVFKPGPILVAQLPVNLVPAETEDDLVVTVIHCHATVTVCSHSTHKRYYLARDKHVTFLNVFQNWRISAGRE